MKFTGAAKDKTCILACADKNTLLLLLFVNGKYRFSNRVRLFYENGTEDYAGEVCSAVSSMIQFSKSQRYGSDIDDSSADLVMTVKAYFEAQLPHLRTCGYRPCPFPQSLFP